MNNCLLAVCLPCLGNVHQGDTCLQPLYKRKWQIKRRDTKGRLRLQSSPACAAGKIVKRVPAYLVNLPILHTVTKQSVANLPCLVSAAGERQELYETSHKQVIVIDVAFQQIGTWIEPLMKKSDPLRMFRSMCVTHYSTRVSLHRSVIFYHATFLTSRTRHTQVLCTYYVRRASRSRDC